jgi:SAM-dependent methyltransferase
VDASNDQQEHYAQDPVAEHGTEVRDVRALQAAKSDWAARAALGDAATNWNHLRLSTNHVRAVQMLDWKAFCPAPGAVVLDLGCGSGWLSAMLSSEPNVQRVLAWDSSPSLLANFLPATVSLLRGDAAKIEPVCGDFLPLVIERDSVDLVVMSSAFHHADRPAELLAELARIIRDNGAVLLLNETPWHPLAFMSFATRLYAAVLSDIVARPKHWSGHLGADHILYDEKLGDRAYTLRTWRRMAREGGWSIEVIDTGMPPYPESYRPRGRLQPNLFHFVLRRSRVEVAVGASSVSDVP